MEPATPRQGRIPGHLIVAAAQAVNAIPVHGIRISDHAAGKVEAAARILKLAPLFEQRKAVLTNQ